MSDEPGWNLVLEFRPLLKALRPKARNWLEQCLARLRFEDSRQGLPAEHHAAIERRRVMEFLCRLQDLQCAIAPDFEATYRGKATLDRLLSDRDHNDPSAEAPMA